MTDCLTKVYYLPIARMEEKRWIHAFPKGTDAKWNAVSSRIWNRVSDSIPYDDKRYFKRVSNVSLR